MVSHEELRNVREYEKQNKNRETLIEQIAEDKGQLLSRAFSKEC